VVQAAVVASSAFCALTTLACALYIRFSGPVKASAAVRDFEQRLETVERSWTQKTVELEGMADAIARDYERVTSARNRLTALEAKAKKRQEAGEANGEGEAQVPVSREDWERYARQNKLLS
jgi:uncharacterized coiled-coil protein SlyX